MVKSIIKQCWLVKLEQTCWGIVRITALDRLDVAGYIYL